MPSPSPSPPPTRMKRSPDSAYNPSDEDIKPKRAKRADGKGGGGKAPPRAWSGAELDTLLTLALAGGATRANFEGRIPGRTGLQCLKTWENTLLPYLHKMAREKGEKGRGR